MRPAAGDIALAPDDSHGTIESVADGVARIRWESPRHPGARLHPVAELEAHPVADGVFYAMAWGPLAPPPPSRLWARWESIGGAHFVEVYRSADGVFFYRWTNGGGTIGADVAPFLARVARGDFLPDVARRGMVRRDGGAE